MSSYKQAALYTTGIAGVLQGSIAAFFGGVANAAVGVSTDVLGALGASDITVINNANVIYEIAALNVAQGAAVTALLNSRGYLGFGWSVAAGVAFSFVPGYWISGKVFGS